MIGNTAFTKQNILCDKSAFAAKLLYKKLFTFSFDKICENLL